MTQLSIDPAHSAIHFSVRHMMFAKVRGSFGTFTSELELDPNDITRGSVRVEIDAASIDTGVGDRDAHLRSGDFLDVEHYPKLRFESQRIELAGERLRLHGELTIRDVTRPVTLDVERLGEGTDPWGKRRLGFAAKGSIDRKDFGLSWNQVLEAGGVLVGDRVEIEIDLQVVEA